MSYPKFVAISLASSSELRTSDDIAPLSHIDFTYVHSDSPLSKRRFF
jgi:hypothetical protein